MNIYNLIRFKNRILIFLNTLFVRSEIKSFGRGSRYFMGSFIVGGKYISIGNNTIIDKHVSITAHTVKEVTNKDIIKIGDNCGIGPYSQITAINKIILGNGVRTGSSILITDNSHGKFIIEELKLRPSIRPLYSEGEVVIGDNVWIGAKVSILPGVHIGESAIIGANSVVTRDIPSYSVAVGSPARIIKQIKIENNAD